MVHVVSMTLPTTTVQKLRVWISHVTYNGTDFKVALYDSANNLLRSSSGTLNISDSGTWKEIVVPSRNVSAGTYRVAWAALANGPDVIYRYKSGTGQTRLSDQNSQGGYFGFPQTPLTDPYPYSRPGADAAGVCIASTTPTPTPTP